MDDVYMAHCLALSAKSKAVRKKAGAVIKTQQGVLLEGYNGTPSGGDNCCEDSYYYHDEYSGERFTKLITRPEVIHAELNCVLKAAREGVSVVGSTLYTTLSPCISCAAMLAQAGVNRVVYLEEYRDSGGIALLRGLGIFVEKYKQ